MIRNISVTGGMSQRWQRCSRNRLIEALNITESKTDHTQVNTSQDTRHIRHHWQTDSSEGRSVQEREKKQETIDGEIRTGVLIKQLQQLKGGMRKTDESRDERNQDSQCHVSSLVSVILSVSNLVTHIYPPSQWEGREAGRAVSLESFSIDWFSLSFA